MWRSTKISRAGIHVLAITISFVLASCTKQEAGDRIIQVINEETMPLNDPDIFLHDGMRSGLYAWGNELINNDFTEDYLSVSESIVPENPNGEPDISGKVVVLAIGGSNPERIFSGLETAQQKDPAFGRNLVFVNGGIDGEDLSNILNPDATYWRNMESLLDDNRVSAQQVQVIFCIEDNLSYHITDIERAYLLKEDYISLLTIIRDKYPNCKLFMVGDRGYSGYTTEEKHMEPIGYNNGWAVKLFIDEYVNGSMPQYPLVNWLDYYWADGENARWDGLTYSESDFVGPTFVHFTTEKANALAAATHEKLKTDAVSSTWYK